MKALIVPQNTDLNKGDQCLNVNGVEFLNRIGYDKVYVVSGGYNDEEKEAQSHQTKNILNLIDNPIKHPSRGGKTDGRLATLKQAFFGVFDFIYYSMILILPKFVARKAFKDFCEVLDEVELVAAKGGGFFHSSKGLRGYYYLFYVGYLLMLSQKFGKKTIFLPNSFGPYTRSFDKWLATKILERCEKVYSRENISLKYLNDIGIKSEYLPDLAFLNKLQNKEYTRNNIAITVRPWRAASENEYNRYINSIKNIILDNPSKHFIFVVQSFGPSDHENDRIAIKMIVSSLPASCTNYDIFESELYYKDLIEFYSKFEAVIATRFHSALFAFSAGVPCITLGYSGFKAKGIMETLGLADYYMDLTKIEYLELSEKLKYLLENRDLVSEQIKNEFKINHSKLFDENK